jgi:hypothetical protein
MFVKGKQFLLLIRHPAYYSCIQSSLVKVLAVIEERKNLRKKNLEAQHWAEPVSLTFHSALRKLNTEHSIGASHQISAHFGKAVSEKKICRNWPILTNKNCLWQPCLLMDQKEMSNLYRGPSVDASYQVSYHLAKRFQRKSCFRNRPIRNKNCLWRPYLQTDQNGMTNWPSCFRVEDF